LSGDAARAAYGIAMTVPPDLAEAMVDDRGGDHLDAALCALQGAWAWRHRDRWPAAVDPAEEGWVADPAAL
ncbi:MAG: hypothetical protein KDE22_03210, partial [Rhodobacterales bacterium]|nr:hypothetical protein [Rhodobacterales bacterium]